MSSSFYIGYLPQAPDDLRRFLRRIISLLFTIAGTVSVTIVLAQERFSPAVFEYSTVRDFEGTFIAAPYPTLVVADAASHSEQHIPLVGVGKHGFADHLGEFDGRHVRLRAKRIYRAEGSMLEVMPGSVKLVPTRVDEATPAPIRMGDIEVTGEIVDSKCFLGVMNPGRSKVHRDCAARCISGGVPPALLAETSGSPRLYLLASAAGGPLDPRTILDRVAEPVVVKGILWKAGDSYYIRVAEVSRR